MTTEYSWEIKIKAKITNKKKKFVNKLEFINKKGKGDAKQLIEVLDHVIDRTQYLRVDSKEEEKLRKLALELKDKLYQKFNTLVEFNGYWEDYEDIGCSLTVCGKLNQEELQSIVDFSKKHNLSSAVDFDDQDGLCSLCIEIKAKKEAMKSKQEEQEA